MADWRNRKEQITNKFKHQLNAKGIDNIHQLAAIFQVSPSPVRVFPSVRSAAPLYAELITA
jgi:hypothetical protein